VFDVRGGHTSFGNSGRTIFANGEINTTNTYTSSMEYVNPSTPGNGASFGTNDTGKAFCGAVADLTRGVIGGGASYSGGTWYYRERMDYVTINTTSSSTSFGSLGWGWAVAGSASSGDNTYGCWSGGVRTSDTQYVGYFERITIQTTGSASGFGSFSGSYARAYGAGFSDETYCFTAGGVNGSSPTYIDHVDKHSITTGGTGTNVASLSAPKYSLSATNNATSDPKVLAIASVLIFNSSMLLYMPLEYPPPITPLVALFVAEREYLGALRLATLVPVPPVVIECLSTWSM
jgi:hypothetical protein